MSGDGILLCLGYHLIARPLEQGMLLFLRAFLPSHAATAAYGVLKVRSFTLLAESTPTVSQSLSVYKWWLKMGRMRSVRLSRDTDRKPSFHRRPNSGHSRWISHTSALRLLREHLGP